MTAGPVYCACGKPLHTKRCLARLFGCKPRAVVRMAAKGLWPSTRILQEYRFTDDMIKAIIALDEQWPKDQPATANEPARRAKAVKPPQPAPRRTRQQQPAPISGSNVRPLIAKGPKRIGRAS